MVKTLAALQSFSDDSDSDAEQDEKAGVAATQRVALEVAKAAEEEQFNRQQLKDFYTIHDRSKIEILDKIMLYYKHRIPELMQELESKYNATPLLRRDANGSASGGSIDNGNSVDEAPAAEEVKAPSTPHTAPSTPHTAPLLQPKDGVTESESAMSLARRLILKFLPILPEQMLMRLRAVLLVQNECLHRLQVLFPRLLQGGPVHNLLSNEVLGGASDGFVNTSGGLGELFRDLELPDGVRVHRPPHVPFTTPPSSPTGSQESLDADDMPPEPPPLLSMSPQTSMDSGCYKSFADEDCEGSNDKPFECEWVVEFECDNGPGGGIEKLREFSPHEFLNASDGNYVAPPPLPLHIETFFCPHAPRSTRPPKGRPPRKAEKVSDQRRDKGTNGAASRRQEKGRPDNSPSGRSAKAAIDGYGECPPLLFDFIVNSGVVSQEWCGASLLLTMAATNANRNSSASSPGKPAPGLSASKRIGVGTSEVPSETDEMIPICQSGIAVLCRRVPHAAVRRPLGSFFERYEQTLRASAMIMSAATGDLTDRELFEELFAGGHYCPQRSNVPEEATGADTHENDGDEKGCTGDQQRGHELFNEDGHSVQQRLLQRRLQHERKFERDSQLQLLFQCLSPSHVLTVLLAASLEFSVLLCSSRYSALTAAAEAIRSLLTPLHWVHIYAPVLPRHLLQHLQCPSPFLVGVHASYAQDAINVVSAARYFTPSAAGSRTADGTRLSLLDPALVIVDLDTGNITHTGQDRGAVLSDVVASAALELRWILNPHLYEADHPLRSFERDHAGGGESSREGGRSSGTESARVGGAWGQARSTDLQHRFPSRQIRRVVRQLLQSLLQGFADYCFPVTSGPSTLMDTPTKDKRGDDEEQWMLVLDEAGFIEDRKAAAMAQAREKERMVQQQKKGCASMATCMELLVRTQSFSNYVCQHGFYHLGGSRI
jgi:hypothetical protein